MIVVTREPRNETYRALLRFAAARCGQFSLVWRDQLVFRPSAHAIADTLKPFLVTETRTDAWPGTRLLGGKAVVRFYSLNRRSRTILSEAKGLYAWLAPALPEDLAFYGSDGTVWLASISHEGDAWFADGSLSLTEIAENVPGIVLGPSA